MPSPITSPLIPPTSNRSTCGCPVEPVQVAPGSLDRARLSVRTKSADYVLGSAAATVVHCRARRAPPGREQSAAWLNRNTAAQASG